MTHNTFILQYAANHGMTVSDCYLYGSRVYGTHTPNSDYDYFAIIKEAKHDQVVLNFQGTELNIQFISEAKFAELLTEHTVTVVEAWLYAGNPFQPNLAQLRKKFSEKASNSWIKCKKKLQDAQSLAQSEQDWKPTYHIGIKSLFHSLRILDFGCQVARTRKIDFNSSNNLWNILQAQELWNWDELQEKFKPEYNRLSSEFRCLAPK